MHGELCVQLQRVREMYQKFTQTKNEGDRARERERARGSNYVYSWYTHFKRTRQPLCSSMQIYAIYICMNVYTQRPTRIYSYTVSFKWHWVAKSVHSIVEKWLMPAHPQQPFKCMRVRQWTSCYSRFSPPVYIRLEFIWPLSFNLVRVSKKKPYRIDTLTPSPPQWALWSFKIRGSSMPTWLTSITGCEIEWGDLTHRENVHRSISQFIQFFRDQ